jgi:DNA-directed RNA polymerase specialized sigma subunit
MNKRELQSYLWLRRNIDQLEEQLYRLEVEATRTTTRLSHLPKGGEARTMQDIVLDMVEVDEKINATLQDSYKLLHKIETAIESLPERERYLIRARYIEGKSWEQIAVDMCYCWQHVHRIHKHALGLLKRCD